MFGFLVDFPPGYSDTSDSVIPPIAGRNLYQISARKLYELSGFGLIIKLYVPNDIKGTHRSFLKMHSKLI